MARLTHGMLTSARRFRLLLVLAASLAHVGCSRHEWRPVRIDECPPEPMSRDSLLVTAAPELPASITGVVLDASGGSPVNQVIVELTGRHRAASTDSAGLFRLDSVPPTAHVLTIRRIGYHPRRVDSVVVTPAAGAHLRVPLHGQPLDGCPGFLTVRVRKPWWKLW